jgi:SAM-dependent methyltransferase
VGRYLLAWEQAQLDRVVADIFGFHALQLGRPALDALRANRMPHRWMLNDATLPAAQPGRDFRPAGAVSVDVAVDHKRVNGTSHAAMAQSAAGWVQSPAGVQRLDVLANFEALPFPSQSLDLVVLAHTLELADDAHQTLREVERVLMPEGRVVVIGFNPASLWGIGGHGARTAARLGLRAAAPDTGELLGPRRLRDWFKLLGLQVETGCFGCYRPPWAGEHWLDRAAWIETAGQRWWPFFGSLYMVVAVKRVHAMRLIGPAWKRRKTSASTQPAVLTPQHNHDMNLLGDNALQPSLKPERHFHADIK